MQDTRNHRIKVENWSLLVGVSYPLPPPPPPLFYEDPPPIRYRLPLSFFQVFSEIVMKVHHPLLSMIWISIDEFSLSINLYRFTSKWKITILIWLSNAQEVIVMQYQRIFTTSSHSALISVNALVFCIWWESFGWSFFCYKVTIKNFRAAEIAFLSCIYLNEAVFVIS